MAKPLARICVYMDAFVCTCNDIVRMRSGQPECTACEAFMEQLDTETCVQMSMLADATDEALGFIRFLDSEQFDTSQLFAEIQMFIERISCLFLRGQCVCSGFTEYMLKWLQTPVQLKLRKKLLVLGGEETPAIVVARCMLRMQHWVMLATETLKAEFPSWESFQAFSLFDLKGAGDIRACEMVDERSALCAKVGKVERQSFLAQLADLRPTAMRIFQEKGCSTREAWRDAVQSSQRNKSMQRRHPVDELCAVTMRFVCWSASTSGCESTFSRQKRALGDLGFCRDTSYLNDQLQIMESASSTKSTSEDEALILLAIQEWREVYGPARASGTLHRVPHMHKGMPSSSSSGNPEQGMKQALARRRSQVASLVDDGDQHLPDAMAAELASLRSDLQRKESTFISKKRGRNLFEGIKEGNVDMKDLTHEELLGLESHVANEMKFNRQLLNPRAKPPPRAVLSSGQSIFVDKQVVISNAVLDRAELVRVADPTSADVIVVPSLAKLGQRISWHAGLNGSIVTVKDTVCHVKKHGAVTVFNRATAIKRLVWMSDAFVASHATIATIIDAAAAKAGSKWVMQPSREEFLRRATALRRRTPTQALAFINKAEKSDEEPHCLVVIVVVVCRAGKLGFGSGDAAIIIIL